MARLAAGHDAALSDLMDRHSERLYHYLLRSLQNEAEAGDLAEETFVRVYQHRDRFNPKQKFSTWLYAIAANLVRDRFRWRSRHPEISMQASEDTSDSDWTGRLPDPSPSPGEALEREERAARIREAVGALPEDIRTPLLLSEYEGLSHAEIAQVVGGSSKAVEMRIYRARQQLRGALAGLLSQV